MNLHNKTIVLTGATGGIGRELAADLAAEWANLILIGKSLPKLWSLSRTLLGHHKIISVDLSTPHGRKKLVSKLRRTQVDLLINCAGIGIYKKAPDITDRDWYNSYELNVHTPFFLTRDLHPPLTVNLGSCSAVQYHPERTLYNSTKAALRTLSLCLDEENKGSIIHVTLDSTLTSFGPLSLADKKELQLHGHDYLSPEWVAKKIVSIIKAKTHEREYVFSSRCFENCGIWTKP